MKQYIAQVSPNKGTRWIDETEAATNNDAEQQKIKPGDLELFKCVQVQYEDRERLDRLRRANIPRQRRHMPTVHGESLDAKGERFIRSAIRTENDRQMEGKRRMPPAAYGRGLLGRRNTVDGAQRRRRDWDDPHARASKYLAELASAKNIQLFAEQV